MHGQFDPVTLPNNEIPPFDVSGPLDEVDSGVDEVRIIFLIAQSQAGGAVMVEGKGSWKRNSSGNRWTGQAYPPVKTFGGAAPKFGPGLARGIGLAIAISKGEFTGSDFVPPSIETLSWCANLQFEKAKTGAADDDPTAT